MVEGRLVKFREKDQQFEFKEGDILLKEDKPPRPGFSFTKIIKVFPIHVKKGEHFKIANHDLIAAEDDYFTAVAWIRGSSFATKEEALQALKEGKENLSVNAVTRGCSMFPERCEKITNVKVQPDELGWYHQWIKKWESRENQID